jgi:hypothetical protein
VVLITRKPAFYENNMPLYEVTPDYSAAASAAAAAR